MDPSVKTVWSDSSSTWGRVPVRTCPLGGTRERQSSPRRHTLLAALPSSPPLPPPLSLSLSLSLSQKAQELNRSEHWNVGKWESNPRTEGDPAAPWKWSLRRLRRTRWDGENVFKSREMCFFFFFLFLWSCREVTWRRCGGGGTTCANTARTAAKSILTSCYLLFFFNIKLQTNWGSRALLEGTVSRSLSLFCGGEETFSESNMSWQAGSRCTHPHLVLPASLWRSLAEMSDPLQILQ